MPIARFLRRWGRVPQGLEQPLIRDHPRDIHDVFHQMHSEIRRIKPELGPRWFDFYFKRPTDAADWLDLAFPIPGGWGSTLIADGPETLRKHYLTLIPGDRRNADVIMLLYKAWQSEPATPSRPPRVLATR